MDDFKIIIFVVGFFAFVLFIVIPVFTGIMRVIAPFLVIGGVLYAFHSINDDKK